MFKTLIRLAIFSAISLNLAQYVIGSYFFGHISSMTLFLVAMTILYFFMRPLLALVGMPDHGVGYLFMSFVVTGVLTYVLTLFIPLFSLRATTISELIIFGFVLPSKHLNVIWSATFSALLISVLMMFFNWLCEIKKK